MKILPNRIMIILTLQLTKLLGLDHHHAFTIRHTLAVGAEERVRHSKALHQQSVWRLPPDDRHQGGELEAEPRLPPTQLWRRQSGAVVSIQVGDEIAHTSHTLLTFDKVHTAYFNCKV